MVGTTRGEKTSRRGGKNDSKHFGEHQTWALAKELVRVGGMRAERNLKCLKSSEKPLNCNSFSRLDQRHIFNTISMSTTIQHQRGADREGCL